MLGQALQGLVGQNLPQQAPQMGLDMYGQMRNPSMIQRPLTRALMGGMIGNPMGGNQWQRQI